MCDAALRQKILDRSRMFVASTPLPLPLANAALCAVRILKSTPGLRQRLTRNRDYFKTALRKAGFLLPDVPGPIFCLSELPPPAVLKLKSALLEAGIYPPFIKYPGGPASGFPPDAPRVETVLLIGAAQILFLDVPDHAAVDLSVRLVQADRRAAKYPGLINAVLRRVARDGKEAMAALDRLRPGLVLLDLRLADGNGISVLERIRRTPSLDRIRSRARARRSVKSSAPAARFSS